MAGTMAGISQRDYNSVLGMSEEPKDSALDVRLLLAAGERDLRKQRLDQEVVGLFEKWRGALLRYLSTFGLPEHDSEEVVQEVFLSLHSHLEKDKARTNLPGWLFRVAHNLALKQRNAERKVISGSADVDSLPHPDLNPEEELASNQRQRRLAAVLHALSEQDRRCLYLRAEGLRYREIAEVLGISLGSIALSLERSLARFHRADRR
ncbi:MAG TPA: sigma-70 family RNA polymerase sigma factor [Bryobacteraceae bacterium]|jgi:RNA polymerase sigma-70 factor (ECF subfamily)|nr:sigma-70 family RNA polymerase sigma factor [Bryobacteraceae bacterium]